MVFPATTGKTEVWPGSRLNEIRDLVLPKEHGSWSLALEPVALGLLAAPSDAGIFLALAAVAGFLMRRPVKVLLQNPADPRRPLALGSLGGLLLLFLAGLLLAAKVGGIISLWPLTLALLLGSLFVWFDARGESRAGLAELAGAGAFSVLPAAFATLAGWPAEKALALAAVMAARSLPSVMLVRTVLRGKKTGAAKTRPALLAAFGAALLLSGLACFQWIPRLMAIFGVLLLLRAVLVCGQSAAKLSARRLGYAELSFGVLLLLVAAAGWRL